MTIEELIKYDASEVRSNAGLFAHFENLYKENVGGSCPSCQFKTTFNAWKVQYSKTNINTMAKNTFILRDTNSRYRVSTTEILSKNASDEIAMAWLELKSYGGNKTDQSNLEKVFKKLPDAYGEPDFSAMKKADLIYFAETNNLPEEEWEGLKVEELREYLISKK